VQDRNKIYIIPVFYIILKPCGVHVIPSSRWCFFRYYIYCSIFYSETI